MGDPLGRLLPALRLLQLLPDSQKVARDTYDGSGDHEDPLDPGGFVGLKWGETGDYRFPIEYRAGVLFSPYNEPGGRHSI